MSAMKAVSVQMGFFSSLLGFFDLVKNLYIEMPHSILHKFHQMFHPCWPNNWLIENASQQHPNMEVNRETILRVQPQRETRTFNGADSGQKKGHIQTAHFS